MTLDISLILLAYLLGSVSTAILLCKLTGLPDPRSQGSGNPGATNVLRFGGKKIAAVVLLGDILKGVIPVLIAQSFNLSTVIIACVGLAAFLGHCFPAYFSFKGGKGVATALGVISGISWPLGLMLIAVWIVTALIYRLSSLAAIIAALLTPITAWLIKLDQEFIILFTIISAILLWRHRSNIAKLIKGAEPKIGNKN